MKPEHSFLGVCAVWLLSLFLYMLFDIVTHTNPSSNDVNTATIAFGELAEIWAVTKH